MPTNDNINYGPAAVPPGKLTTGYAYTPPVPIGIPVTEQPVATPAVPTAIPIPVTEQAVDTSAGANNVAAPAATNQQRYITVLANGTVITSNTSSLNFIGNGVVVSNSGTTGANIVITAGGSDYGNSNVSTFLAAFGSNVVSTTGNVTAGYVFGNGSQLTGLAATYSNANVITLLSSLGSNIISGTGNITTTANISGGYILGNGSQLSGLPATYGNANVVANLAALGTNPVSTTGNVTGNYFIGNGSTLTSIAGANVTGTVANATYATSAGSATTAATVTTAAQGNITSVGTLTSLSTTGNITSGNLLTAGLITATGNITGNYFIGNGSQLTGISAGANTGNVTFNDVNIIGTGNLNLQPIGASSEYLNIYLTGAADIHVAYGGGSGNVILGTDEEANVAVLQGGNVAIQAGNVAGTKTWTFDTAGNLTLPMGGIVYETNIPDGALSGSAIALKPTGGTTANQQLLIYPTANDGDHIHMTSGNLYTTELFLGSDNFYVKLANTGNVVINSNDGNSSNAMWTFGSNGNLTLPGNTFAVNYANGTAVSLGGSYGNAEVVANLAALGTNPVSTTGNVTGGNLLFGSGIISGTGNITGGNLDLSYMGGAARGNLTGGNISVTGNITGGNIITAGLLSTTGNVRGGNILTAGAVSASSTITGANLATGGTVSATGNVQGGNIVTGGLISATGNITTAGNILNQGLVSSTGNAIHGNILTGGLVSAAGNITASNVFSSATMSTGGNIFAALNISATGTVYGSNFNTTGLISAGGNVTVGNLLTAGVASATGNIVTAGNFVGNGAALSNVTVSVAGNIIGTQSNVTLVAGAYSWTFNNAGNLTLPGNTFSVNYANNTQVNAVTRFEAAWTVPVGNSTQSFTVGANETYYLWVDCNIPNGILTWNATATVTNTNVPVVGVQYAWVYNGGGTPIDFTSIPNQFTGTANTIVRSNVAPSSTTNRFDFGINNTSGASQTVRYGWIAIS